MSDTTRSAKQLIADALKRAPDNNYEAADLLGVSEGTIRRWRDGVVPERLRADTRHALEAYVDGKRVGTKASASRMGDDSQVPPGLPEDWKDQTFVEVLLREARAAEKRAEAAASWARWLEKEADASERVRAYAMREQKPTGAKPSPYRPAPGARGTEKEGEVGETGS